MFAVSIKVDTAPDSDAGLMRLVAAGDPRAQRLLAHRLAARVRRVSQRLLRNGADADDAAQLALLEILRSARTYGDRSSIERWADRITVRTSIRFAREQRRHAFAFGGLTELEPLASFRRDRHLSDETPRSVEDYLSKIPEGRREALVLKHGLGYTTEEIAELIDKPIGTVKDRLVAARKQLRKLIQRDVNIGTRLPGGEHE